MSTEDSSKIFLAPKFLSLKFPITDDYGFFELGPSVYYL